MTRCVGSVDIAHDDVSDQGRLGELEPLLLCGLAFSMARAFSGCGEEPCARAAELVRILSRVLGNDWLGPMGS